MSNTENNALLDTTPVSDTSPENIANLLLGGGGAIIMDDDEASLLAYEQKLLSDIQSLRVFAEANELDSKKIVDAIEPYYTKQIPEDLEHAFSRLEIVAMEHETYVSVYIDETEASLVLWCCKDADGSQVKFDDVYLPYHSVSDLGADYRPKYSNSIIYGQSVDPMNAVRLYNNHKAEIVELNINNCLRDIECLFEYLVKYIKQGLSDVEIAKALDNIDSELDNEAAIAAEVAIQSEVAIQDEVKQSLPTPTLTP
jgi:hypothetical protein